MLAWLVSLRRRGADTPPSLQHELHSLATQDWRSIGGELLASAPTVVDLARLHVVSLYEELPDGSVAAALNGTVVALAELAGVGPPGSLEQAALQVCPPARASICAS